jgi:hypothetical protein
MLPNYYSTNAICIECNEGIFNPICPKCLAREIGEWLKIADFDGNDKEKVEWIVNCALDRNFLLEKVSSQCIICRKGNSYMCPYCFTEKILDSLRRERVSGKVIGQFLEFFNFDFERTGYAKESE